MKTLITGGAGYKGLKLAQALLERGHTVMILDNFLYGAEPTLFLCAHPRIGFERRDIREVTERDLAGYDCIFHLAGISGYPACEANPHSAVTINVEATRRLLAGLSREQLLVYASTTSVYGRCDLVCDEHSPVSPASRYARTKLAAEQLCLERENSIALRFATLYGVAPRMRWELLLNNFVLRAVRERSLVLFDPGSTRTFLHLDDAIRGYLLALDQADRMAGGVYNVGSEELNHSKLELARQIRKQVEFEIICSELGDLDVRSFTISFARIRALGFQPAVTLDQGIAELVKLFRYYNPIEHYKVI